MSLTVERGRLPVATSLIVLSAVLAACSGGSTPAPSGAASAGPSGGGSTAPSASPAASPSTASASAAPSSGGASAVPSIAIPSLPSDDKGLEALLPSTLCGQTAVKTSLSGANFTSSADPEFVAVLNQLGKSASDVVFAAAGAPSGDCSTFAGVFRVKGADAGQLKDVFLAEAAKSGTTPEQKTVGGKTVWVGASDSGSGNDYAYFVGDAIFFVSADTDAAAAEALQSMP